MRVGVVGGGLAGLVAAHDLAVGGAEVILLEAGSELGGQIRTRRSAGFVVEDGAEGWVAADVDVPALCRSLGLGEQLVQQLERRSLLFSKGSLSEIRPGGAASLLGIQASDSDLGRGISSLRTGMGTLTDSLGLSLLKRDEIRLECRVTSIERGPHTWRLSDSRGRHTEVEALIVAAPTPTLAALVEPHSRDAAQALRRIELASNVSVSVGYARAAVRHPLDASGIVVDPGESHEGLRACAFSSSKLPGRSPAGQVLLRAFFRPTALGFAEDDDAWRDRAVRLLGPVLGLAGQPMGAWVARWPSALPQYTQAHSESVEEAALRLRDLGPIELAGTSYHPGGIPGAVRSGHDAAQRLLGIV